jgi:cytochrome c553
MSSVAHDLSDAEIGELAGWFAAQPWDAFSFDYDPRQVVAGAKLVSRFQCASCHTASFTGSDVVPRTAGQNPVYLARQLRAFAAGTRYHPPTGTGARMFRLQPDEIDALAQFLAQLGSPDPAREP